MDSARIRHLLDKRDEIDAELASIIVGGTHQKKAVVCSLCKGEGHTARTCPSKPAGTNGAIQ